MVSSDLDRLMGFTDGQAEFDKAIWYLDSKFPGVANVLAWKDAVFTAQPQYRAEEPGLADHQLYVARRWIELANKGCLDVRMDHVRGLIVDEKPGGDSAQRAHSSDEIRPRLRKLLFNKLNELPATRSLQIYEVMTAFQTAAGESLKNYSQEFSDVVDELSEKSYIRLHQQGGSGMQLFFKGLAFDAWQEEMMTKRSLSTPAPSPVPVSPTYIFNASVGAVQTGGNSVAYVQQSADHSQLAGLKSALEAVLIELAKANLPADEREDAEELVQTIIAEVQKEKPNKLSLKSLLGGVATTIQTLGSTSEAYTALKAAATVAGITLP